tara:strand:- start:511 stop:1131 length:621 start_codon:yes stop_codon:yes gene_type:complete
MIRMSQFDLQHCSGWQLPNHQLLPALNNERKKVKSTWRGGRPPAKVAGKLREFYVHGIPEDHTVSMTIARITDKLVIPDPDLLSGILPTSEDCLSRHNPPSISRSFKMLHTYLEHRVGRRDQPGIYNLERLPVQAPYTAHRFSPGLPGSFLHGQIRALSATQKTTVSESIPAPSMVEATLTFPKRTAILMRPSVSLHLDRKVSHIW